jgi:hypothetical protein
MFTVKIFRQKDVSDVEEGPSSRWVHTTVLEEAEKVVVYRLRDGLFEIYGERKSGGDEHFCHYISNPENPRPKDFADEVEFGYRAYIENAVGKTTEVVGW